MTDPVVRSGEIVYTSPTGGTDGALSVIPLWWDAGAAVWRLTSSDYPMPISGGTGSGSSGGTVAQGASGTAAAAWYVNDAQSAPFGAAATITPGTAFTAGRSIGVFATVAGNITLTLATSGTITLPVSAGAFYTLPFAATNLTLGSGTAGTFWSLN